VASDLELRSNRECVISIVIPAYNEADYLPVYLPTVLDSLWHWESAQSRSGEVIVVDNCSSDGTAAVATNLGAAVSYEEARSIAASRNRGAADASGTYLFFVDADVRIHPDTVRLVVDALDTGQYIGGAINPVYTPLKRSSQLLCRFWDRYRKRHGGAQGVAQFCRADTFRTLGGYREDLYMSEDVEFFFRLRSLASRKGKAILLPPDHTVEPSTRRYDKWPWWRMFFWQNPMTARMFLSSRRFWRHWYECTVR
jgi:glycosyltransferase involved in cell wall biosynthesis